MDLMEARERRHEPDVRHPWETARVQVVRRLIAHAFGQDVPPAEVVDVGCGDTFVVESLAAQLPGTQFYAVDPALSEDLIERYRRRLGGAAVHLSRSLDGLSPSPRSADLVLLLDVVEHVEDDRAFLADLRRQTYVTRDTRLLVTVPAFQALYCSHDTFLGHYRRYTRAELHRALTDAGYQVLESGYFFGSLLPVRAVQAARDRWVRPGGSRTTGVASWKGGRFRAALLETVLLWDARAALALGRIGLVLPGLSAYALCRPSV